MGGCITGIGHNSVKQEHLFKDTDADIGFSANVTVPALSQYIFPAGAYHVSTNNQADLSVVFRLDAASVSHVDMSEPASLDGGFFITDGLRVKLNNTHATQSRSAFVMGAMGSSNP